MQCGKCYLNSEPEVEIKEGTKDAIEETVK